MPVATLLNAASANTAGPVTSPGTPTGTLTLAVSTTGTVSAFSVVLQGSLDGTSWEAIGSPVTAVTAGTSVGTGVLFGYFQALLSGYSGTGTVTAKLAYSLGAGAGGLPPPTGVTAGTYSNATVVVAADGRLTGASSGSASGMGNPMTTAGDLIDGGAGGTPARLAGNTSATKNFLTSTGTGSAAQAPAWGAIQAGDVPALSYDASGAAAAAQAAAQAASLALTGGTMSGAIAMGANKVTGLTNGSAAQDAVTFSQLTYGGVFGDGSDGAATLDGTNTVTWASKSGNTYTMTRDCYLTSLTISSGVTLNLYTAGAYSDCLIFCTGTVTNGGTIAANGQSASGTNGSVAGGASLGGSVGPSGAGGAGGTGVGAAGTAVNPAMGVGYGGAGGAGGSAGGATAGGNSASTYPFRRPQSIMAGFSFLGSPWRIAGGGGGASGGGDGTNKGGGGGAGGGVIAIFAHAVVNNGTISATGGNGGTPTTTTGACGGGGPGGGGSIFIYTLTAWTAGTTVVTGGSVGTGAGTGGNGVVNGTNPNGAVLNVVVQ